MNPLEALAEQKLAATDTGVSVVLPGGRRIGPPDARVTLTLRELSTLAHLAGGHMGKIGEDYVEGKVDIGGNLRDLMQAAARLIGDPTHLTERSSVLGWWQDVARHGRSRLRHTTTADARQVQFHYDVSDDFYALWLDPRRVYSCAYYRDPGMTLAQAQEAKLDHICRKLALREGERFLDIGAGWGGLLLWAAEQYGVNATGITLSKNQHAYVNGLIEVRGMKGRVTMALCDYRDLPEDDPWDKIASVGMFEHVGRANLPTYFAKIRRLLKPGGLLMNHGITAGGTRNDQLGSGLGDFMERYIFPGGELLHVSHVLRTMAETGLEMLDVENLRPHYARTLWAWSDNLESRLAHAREVVSDRVLRAYRLYLAGSAVAFEHGWIALHQMLAVHPSGKLEGGPMLGSQSSYPFNREYMYR
ncbi:MAG TPA: class I SAM-dependent methyltransferase [Burkholderiaceae bacterium]|nr:class I SAM-dependent methyltransferase [Burkholderiaceae bacterium]